MIAGLFWRNRSKKLLGRFTLKSQQIGGQRFNPANCRPQWWSTCRDLADLQWCWPPASPRLNLLRRLGHHTPTGIFVSTSSFK